MTAPSALALIAEVARLGGRLEHKPPDKLHWRMPFEPSPRLLEAMRQRKPDLLMLLAKPEGPCPVGHPAAYWQDAVGQWHCLGCEPNPAWRYLRGVNLETLAGRAISLTPPSGDLGDRGSWARTPTGDVVELVLYREDGGEVLMRSLRDGRLEWYAPEVLAWEWTWRSE